jgi:hypothetical protein
MILEIKLNKLNARGVSEYGTTRGNFPVDILQKVSFRMLRLQRK